MKHLRHREITVALLALSGLWIHTTVGTAADTAHSSLLPVETARIRLQDSYRMQRTFTGRVEARRKSELGFESAGRLARVLVDEGDLIERGALIAELDDERLQAQREELVAARLEAEANLALTSATLKRLRAVVDTGGVSRQGLDEALAGQRAASAALRLAEQRLASNAVGLAKTRLYAPFAGAVVARQSDEGRVLNAGTPVVTLQETGAPEIRVGIAGQALEQLIPGRTYQLSWRAARLPARLRVLLPVRAASARTVSALFEPVTDDPGLLPGDIVTLRLENRIEQRGAWLPLTALTGADRGLWSVFVGTALDTGADPIGQTRRVERRTVDVIHQAGDEVFVRGALSAGEQIIVSGLQRIVPGQIVRTGATLAANRGQHND